MSRLRVHRFPTDVSFYCSGLPPTVDPETEAEVANIWRSASADPARRLSDNLILVVKQFDATVEVAPIPYRYFLAQTMRPKLFQESLKALAVSGLVQCQDRYVMGRRASWITRDAGALELAPSGSVDADVVRPDGHVDLDAQFDREISEELGIAAEMASARHIIGFVDDRENHVLDVVVAATLACTFEELREAHSRLDRREYSSLLGVTADELEQMIDDGRDRISAVSSAIFSHFVLER